jgi:hypothetical protein
LACSGRPIDSSELAAAVEEQSTEESPDFRTRLLIRDSLNALLEFWGREKFTSWLSRSAAQERLDAIRSSDLGPPGFSTLVHRVMDTTRPQLFLQFFRDLGSRVRAPMKLDVGGSTSLILAGALSRHTEDIAVVDEVPSPLRVQHELLDELARSYGLTLAHFQSHYLPTGWQTRMRSLGRFGEIDVFLVDVYDVLLSKLFSTRRKDLDDLRAAMPRLDKQTLESRLQQHAGALLGEPQLAENAKRNWYIVYGEPLPG